MLIFIALLFIMAIVLVVKIAKQKEYRKLEKEVLEHLGFSSLEIFPDYDEQVVVKSRQSLEKYDEIKFFKEDKTKLEYAEMVLTQKQKKATVLKEFLKNNQFESHSQYETIKEKINDMLSYANFYIIDVVYISSAGNNLDSKTIFLSQCDLNKFKLDPSILMSKSEFNKLLKEEEKAKLEKKHAEYYGYINEVIDFANKNKNILVIKDSSKQVDSLITQLFDRTVNSIKKIKTINSEEWQIIKTFIDQISDKIQQIVYKNQQIIAYYDSEDFARIKMLCESLMSTQREFNEYVNEKAQSISKLLGTRIVRTETINNDEYEYIRPYQKTITPFTAEVSATVFASAENRPLDYVVKYFYPNKAIYSEQIQKLHLLIEELETLREAKQIIDNYKKEYQQYLVNVPDYILKEDEAGFYSRLGFANIDEEVLIVEYKFSYTSNGGFAQRFFTVPMTEDTIIELIKILESKLTAKEFAKTQRAMMTKKLRESIKIRDNFTCCNCGNSTHIEPNLLLEIDHILPIAKGGCTVENNLQTLCWKCNRSKGSKF